LICGEESFVFLNWVCKNYKKPKAMEI
jgi:hypothetical protein